MSDPLWETWEGFPAEKQCSIDIHGNPIDPPITISVVRWRRLVSRSPEGPLAEIIYDIPQRD